LLGGWLAWVSVGLAVCCRLSDGVGLLSVLVGDGLGLQVSLVGGSSSRRFVGFGGCVFGVEVAVCGRRGVSAMILKARPGLQ